MDRWLEERLAVGLCDAPILGVTEGMLERLAHVDDTTPSLGTRDQTELSRTLAAARAEGGHAARQIGVHSMRRCKHKSTLYSATEGT